MQFDFNNTLNIFIELTLNQLKFDLFSQNLISLLDNNKSKNKIVDLNLTKIIYRKKIVNVIFYVNVQIKLRYDNKHKSLKLNVDDQVYLQLYYEY